MLLGKGRDWRVRDDSRTGDSLDLATRGRSVSISAASFSTTISADVLLKVLLIAVEVLCAGKRVLKEDQDGQEHLRRDFLVNAFELFQVDASLLPKDFVDEVLNFLLVLQTVQKDLANIKRTNK